MVRVEVFLLPQPGGDASPSQGYPPALNSPVPIYTSGWSETLRVKRIVQEHSTMSLAVLKPGLLDPGADALTMRPSRIADILEKDCRIPGPL